MKKKCKKVIPKVSSIYNCDTPEMSAKKIARAGNKAIRGLMHKKCLIKTRRCR